MRWMRISLCQRGNSFPIIRYRTSTARLRVRLARLSGAMLAASPSRSCFLLRAQVRQELLCRSEPVGKAFLFNSLTRLAHGTKGLHGCQLIALNALIVERSLTFATHAFVLAPQQLTPENLVDAYTCSCTKHGVEPIRSVLEQIEVSAKSDKRGASH